MSKKQINCSVCLNYNCKDIAGSGGFKYWGCLVSYLHSKKRTKCLMWELAKEAQKFLPEYHFQWRGGVYICKLPYGGYVWHFAVRMKQEQIWNYREFQEGYKFGLCPSKPYRDANPYQEWSRRDSWDCGYILGLSKKKDK